MIEEQRYAAAQLVGIGMKPHDVAVALGVSKREVESLTSSRITTTLKEEDQRLAEAMRQLAWKANEYALETFEFGHPREKAELTRAILGRTMGLVGLEQTQQVDTLRQEFEKLLRDARGTDSSIEEVSPHVALSAPPIDVDDPDEGRNN